MINFCYDDLGEFGIGYPNLARPGLSPDQFDDTWPRSIPIRLLVYFETERIANQAHLVSSAPVGSWYPVAWAWHDFTCDYIGLISQTALSRLRAGEIRLLFYYHEGDNPARIIQHLHERCLNHQIPEDCFLLVSANSAADRYRQGCYFPDHEYFFRWINQWQPTRDFEVSAKSYQFTALNRTHKDWRAMIMADLVASGLLDRSQWSYNTDISLQEDERDNPLQWQSVPDWRAITQRFIEQGPYFCDDADSDLHNDHQQVNIQLYSESACHLVIETLLDADSSDGVFLTEKTYKCIKFAQPFVIVGTPGSLAQLRRDGYRTFDKVIDPSYDDIVDNSQRYLEIKRLLDRLRHIPGDQLLAQCRDDVLHNQEIFICHRSMGLTRLLERLSRPMCGQVHTGTP